MKRKRAAALIVLFTLSLCGLISIYQALFDLWMTAYPFANISVWRTRLYLRSGTVVIVGLLWIAVFIWLVRHKIVNKQPPR